MYDELYHSGVAHDEDPPGRGSGRYGYGTGKNPYQHAGVGDFTKFADELRRRLLNDQGYIDLSGSSDEEQVGAFRKKVMDLKKQVSNDSNRDVQKSVEKEVAEMCGMTIREMRARFANDSADLRKEYYSKAKELFDDKHYGYTEIAKKLTEQDPYGKKWNESSVRSLLNPETAKNKDKTIITTDRLKEEVSKKGYVDVGKGTEYDLDITKSRLTNALARLEDEGYALKKIQIEQQGTGHKTTMTVLAAPGTSYHDIYQNLDKIKPVNDMFEDNGATKLGVKLQNLDSSRIAVRYGDAGGADKEGVIELRKGVADLSLGKAQYAQVRIAVDGTHYLKGMAMYSDDIPEGKDIVFNTKKDSGIPLIGDGENEIAKKMKRNKDGSINEENPFGASIKPEEKLKMVPRYYTDENGVQHVSPINIVNEEGDWSTWSKTLSAQFLSKQGLPLIRRQLALAYESKAAEFEEIKNITNPVLKQKLLLSFADDCDAAAVHLKAFRLPGQSQKVILPFPDMQPNQCYLPGYKNGTQVCLIRYPHAGTFEIPQLVVNNNSKAPKSTIGNALDAIGVHPSVLPQLSGADSDGDTVLVIPLIGKTKVRASKAIDELINFDHLSLYKLPEDAPKMKSRTKQTEMGKVTNLIMDMQLKGATADGKYAKDVIAAVKYSMVIIDAEKHHLDYRRAYKELGIQELKNKWQRTEDGRTGAGTLITRAKSPYKVPLRKAWNASQIDPETGEKIYKYTNEEWTDKKGKTHKRLEDSTRMAETNDARTLLSNNPNPKELVYADYANSVKKLANDARLEYLHTKTEPINSSARKLYAEERESLTRKLAVAVKNAPRERQAQLLAGLTVKNMRAENPDMDAEEVKKMRGQAIVQARINCHAKKERIEITPREWEAIQARAISASMLRDILDNTDLDDVKKMATPRTWNNGISPAKLAHARNLMSRGYSQEDAADAIGFSVSAMMNALNKND